MKKKEYVVSTLDTKDLTRGKKYDVISFQKDWFTIIDDQGDEHLFNLSNFDKFFSKASDKLETAVEGLNFLLVDSENGVKKDNGKAPLGIVCQRQFPNALKMISEGSKAVHEKYKDTDLDWLNFKRVKGGKDRYLNALYRHLAEAGKDFENVDEETNVKHISLAGWNLLALLETIVKDD